MTPVNAKKLGQMLNAAGYDKQKTKFVVSGFENGFSISYEGDQNIQRTAPNLQLHVRNEVILWNKVMKEVNKLRYAGPFSTPPFEHFIQSPIGLVPKDNGKDTRFIFHLSYPRSGKSVNSETPKDACSVKYCDFDQAIKRCLEEGIGCNISRSDISSAFRNLGILPEH